MVLPASALDDALLPRGEPDEQFDPGQPVFVVRDRREIRAVWEYDAPLAEWMDAVIDARGYRCVIEYNPREGDQLTSVAGHTVRLRSNDVSAFRQMRSILGAES
ncbi:hypothetical protein HUG10_21415 (plasmid) [Halorarum halophilum]|uniref:Uncharacterized protein n=1 Tax=Halorarum halophilum TaxID=2743090 RepID=A0A7D5H075_9EURY|nr:hypothetical protein [Halobaculum halophilum]QLG30149.1 hypothetical protein HUG10_21415 [Halobaculum halophilum]